MRAVSQIPSNHRNIRHKLHQNRPKPAYKPRLVKPALYLPTRTNQAFKGYVPFMLLHVIVRICFDLITMYL